MVAIIAALPRELSLLVGKQQPDPQLLKRGISLYRMPQGVAVTAGMGASRVALAVEAARNSGAIDTLISVGLSGSCTAAMPVGSSAEVTIVVDANTGERYATQQKGTPQGEDGLILATTASIASVEEKARLAATYQASLVDMEAATVARLATAHGLFFRAIKGVSDAHDFELQGLSRFTGSQGEFRTAAFALYTALRPAMWPKAITLGKYSNQALQSMTVRLRDVLAGR